MKKFFMIAIMAVAALTVNAQSSDNYKKFHITPYMGVGYGNLSDNNTLFGKNSDFVTANIGGEFEFMATKNFGISAGVGFMYAESPKKDVMESYSTSKGDVSFSSAQASQNFSFMNVPVLAQYHVGGFTFKAGVQANFLLDANLKLTSDVKVESGGTSIHTYAEGSNSIKDAYNTVTWSIPVGVSYTFKVPVTVGVDCSIPVSTFTKKEFDVKQKFTPVMLTVGYRF